MTTKTSTASARLTVVEDKLKALEELPELIQRLRGVTLWSLAKKQWKALTGLLTAAGIVAGILWSFLKDPAVEWFRDVLLVGQLKARVEILARDQHSMKEDLQALLRRSESRPPIIIKGGFQQDARQAPNAMYQGK